MNLNWQQLKDQIDDKTFTLIKDVFETEGHQSAFQDLEENFYYITRFLKIQEDELVFASMGYFFFQNHVYFYQKESETFVHFADDLEKLFDVLEEVYDSNQAILNFYIEEIEKKEDLLYERVVPATFMDTWFDLKKDVSRIDRYFGRQIMAFNDMVKWMGKYQKEFVAYANSFVHDVRFSQSNAQGGLSRLDNLHHYYSSIKNDKLNRNIYLLTVLSGIFLPLNLIVGFFGMNTEGLLFKDNPKGTMYVMYTLSGILLLSLLGTNIFRVLDRLFLKRLLGRTSFYKRLDKNIGKIEENFSIKL
jgi:magnesium transporter